MLEGDWNPRVGKVLADFLDWCDQTCSIIYKFVQYSNIAGRLLDGFSCVEDGVE